MCVFAQTLSLSLSLCVCVCVCACVLCVCVCVLFVLNNIIERFLVKVLTSSTVKTGHSTRRSICAPQIVCLIEPLNFPKNHV